VGHESCRTWTQHSLSLRVADVTPHAPFLTQRRHCTECSDGFSSDAEWLISSTFRIVENEDSSPIYIVQMSYFTISAERNFEYELVSLSVNNFFRTFQRGRHKAS